MSIIERRTNISAPTSRIFGILDEPTLITLYAPGASRVTDVHRSEQRLGDSMRVTYSVMGLSFPMTMTVAEYSKDASILARMTGAMSGTFAWSLTPAAGDATTVT